MAWMNPYKQRSATAESSVSSRTLLNTAKFADQVFSNIGKIVEMSLISTNLLFL